MTAFGKLLVFMNLVFSVVTGALIVFVFTTRANWVAAYKHAEAQAKSAEVAYKAERGAHENDIKQKDAHAAGLQAEVERLKSAVTAAQQEATAARELATKNEGLNAAATTAQAKSLSELAQIQTEREKLAAQQAELRQKIVDVQKELDKQRGEAVLADLRAKNMEQKANNLLRQVEDLTVRNRELESDRLTGTVSGSPGTVSTPGETPKAAPSGVRGKVVAVGAAGSNLASVNIGSDSGLSVGTSLIVYRGNEYLGDLKLTSVNPKEAVGTFTPARKNAQVLKDDLVITSFTGVSQ